MDGKVYSLNKALRGYDSQLFAVRTKDRIDVMRSSSFGFHPPHFLFCLTDTWTTKGRSVDWGIEPVMSRIKAIDIWRDDTMVERLLNDYQEDEKAQERSMHNNIEAFLYDFRSEFKKTFSDVNTASMEKLYRTEDKKNGYCKPRS